MMTESQTEKKSSKVQYERYENFLSYEEAMRERRNNILNVIDEISSLDSKEKIIKLIELEYEDLEKQQAALFYSNEEMFLSCPDDTDVIEFRAENMKFIEKNLKRMKEIKGELMKLDKSHSIKDKDVFYIGDFNKSEEEIKEGKIGEEKVNEEEEILNEIEL